MDIKNTVHSTIGWCAVLATGISLSNTVLGIGLEVAFGASLGNIRIKKKNSLSEVE